METYNYYSYEFYTKFLELVLKKLNLCARSKSTYSVQFKIQILLCQTIIFSVFAEVPMCEILKKYRKSFFQKRFVIMFAMFVSKMKQNKLLLQESNRRWYCASVESTVAQVSILRLYKCQFNDCTSNNSIVGEASNRQLQSSNRRLY